MNTNINTISPTNPKYGCPSEFYLAFDALQEMPAEEASTRIIDFLKVAVFNNWTTQKDLKVLLPTARLDPVSQLQALLTEAQAIAKTVVSEAHTESVRKSAENYGYKLGKGYIK